MNIVISQSTVADKGDVNLIDLFNEALEKFARRADAMWSIAKMNEDGMIIMRGFSNNTMLPTLAMLIALCYEYPLVFTFQVQNYSSETGLPALGFWVNRGKMTEAIELINRANAIKS